MKSHTRQVDVCEQKAPRVLVVVRGGVAYVCADDRADVFVIDYDNEPEAVVPEKYSDLAQGES